MCKFNFVDAHENRRPPCVDFHETNKRSAAIRGDHLYRISAELFAFSTLSISAKLALTDNFVTSSYAKFHENPTNNLRADGRSHADRRTNGCGVPQSVLL